VGSVDTDSAGGHVRGGKLHGLINDAIGVREISRAIADRESAFGMETLRFLRNPEQGHGSVDKMFGPDDLQSCLRGRNM
jgi:phosphoglycerate dehydrogenase-like enzyme